MSVLKTNSRLVNDKIKFEITARDNPPVYTDYVPPIGDLDGFMPLELFLGSLSTCLGGNILSIVRKMGFQVDSFAIDATGQSVETHPKYFERIDLLFTLKSPNATLEGFQKALQLSETKYCPFTAMLNDKVKVHYDLKLEA